MTGGLWPTIRRNVILVPLGTFGSEMLVQLHQTTLRDVPHDYNTDIYRCENLKYHTQNKSSSLPIRGTISSGKHDSDTIISTSSRNNLFQPDPY